MKTKLNNETSDLQKDLIMKVKCRLNYFKAKEFEKGRDIYSVALEATKKYVDVAKDALEFMERTGDIRDAVEIVAMLDRASEIYVSTVRILDEQYKLKKYTRRADCSLMSLAF